MFKTALTGLAIGGIGYYVFNAVQGARVQTNDSSMIGGLVGAFINTAYQAADTISGGAMRISIKGLAHIKGWEGYRSRRYLDAAGKPTIGYGHLLKLHENFDTVTEAQATALLLADVASAEAAINKGVTARLTQNQFDALVSFAYNVGNNGFLTSTLLKMVNAGNFTGAVQQFGRWVYVTRNGKKMVVAGLVNRRQADANLFAGVA